MKTRSYFLVLSILVSALLLLSMQWSILPYPGVNYDEVMWVNVALKTGNTLFIHDSIMGWPVMLMPYIGALKGYLYKAIFIFFEPSVISLRVPMILLAAAGIALFSSALYLYCDEWVGRFVFVFLLLNPLVGMHSALDLGPSNIEFFLKCIVFFILMKSIAGRQSLNIWLLSIIFLLGIWNKLSFVWFLNSIFLLWIILKLVCSRFKNISNEFCVVGSRKKYFCSRYSLFIFIPSYILFGIIFYFNIYRGVNSPIEQADYLPMKLYYIFDLFSGISYYNSAWIIRSSFVYTASSFACLVFIFIAMRSAILDIYNCWIKSMEMRELSALSTGNIVGCTIATASFIQFLVTREAIQPWHAYTLFPAMPLIVATGALLWFNSFDKSTDLLRRRLIIFVLTFIALAGLMARIDIAKNISQSQPGKYSWTRLVNSNVSGNLFEWLKGLDRRIKFLDWGFMTQAIFFDHTKSAKYEDLYWMYNGGINAKHFAGLDSTAVFITHGKQTSAYPDARSNFFKSAKLANVELCELKSFSDGDDVVFAQAWQVCGVDKINSTLKKGGKYVVDYFADVEAQNDVFRVVGKDPQIYFALEDVAAHGEVVALAFRFKCEGERGDAALQVFFKSASAGGFKEQLSARVTPVSGLVYINISRLKLTEKIDFHDIRIDLDPPQSCAVFSIDDLRTYGDD